MWTWLWTPLQAACLTFLCVQKAVARRQEVTKYINNFMKQSPAWEANRFSASQETPRILWNPKVHYRFHLSISWARSIQSMRLSHFLKIHSYITLSSMPVSPKWPLSLRFLHQKPVCISLLPLTRYMPSTSHFFSIYPLEYYLVRSTAH